MKHGFFKTAAETVPIKTADPGFNAENIIAAMQKAEENKVKLLVFPELCLTGYTSGDLFFQDELREKAVSALFKVLSASKNTGAVTFLGLPLVNNSKLYNCAAAIYKGEILGIIPKSFIPNYCEFYE